MIFVDIYYTIFIKFFVRCRPLVAMIGNKAAMEEVRQSSIERDQVCIGRRSRLDGWVEQTEDCSPG